MKVRKAIIPAAGLGTRFLPATKAQPKEMLPIVDKPTIQYIVEEAVASGIEDIIIVTAAGKRAIEDHFDKSYELEEMLRKKGKQDLLNVVQIITNMVNIHYIRQKEPKGLGHAIFCARTFIGEEPFAILLGDNIIESKEPCLSQLIDVYDQCQTTVIGVQAVPQDKVQDYGIVDVDFIKNRLYMVKGLVEKPEKSKAPSNMAILGRYIITPRIFDFLERAEPGKDGEIQLTDALRKLSEVEMMYAYEFEGKQYDVGSKIGFLKATVEFALKHDDLRNDFTAYLKEIASKL